ncbi:hypothetical protein BN1263170199 [Stenotrophomonas maltophilia]|nr:hypothetical protein BN1263170199 [Stenotrophomonas maltophilia]
MTGCSCQVRNCARSHAPGKAEGRADREAQKSRPASHGLALLGLPASGRHYQSIKKAPTKAGAFLQLVPETGVEPATYALRMRRSTN